MDVWQPMRVIQENKNGPRAERIAVYRQTRRLNNSSLVYQAGDNQGDATSHVSRDRGVWRVAAWQVVKRGLRNVAPCGICHPKVWFAECFQSLDR